MKTFFMDLPKTKNTSRTQNTAKKLALSAVVFVVVATFASIFLFATGAVNTQTKPAAVVLQ
ncbi:MAG: hypothetical protein WC471_03775 [Candidatus Woesearchaeota archaeon]